MPRHIKQRRGEVFRRGIALIELARFLDLIHQGVGHRLAGLVMLRIAGEYGWVKRPMLVELRWKLDKVARHDSESRIAAVIEHSVQRMAEFVKNRGHVIESQQGRLTGSRLGKVGDVEERRLCPEQAARIDETVFPCSALLVRAGKVVTVVQRQRFAVPVKHLKDTHVRLINGYVLALFEGKAVKLVRGKEDTVLQHSVQFEVRLDL